MNNSTAPTDVPTIKEIEQALENLECLGLIRKTGVFRTGKSGVPQPVYVAVPEDEMDEAAKAYARVLLLRQGERHTA
jgi:hypothetical protein